MAMYYDNKIESLKDIFGRNDIKSGPGYISVGDKNYPVIGDVIILSPPEKYSAYVKKELGVRGAAGKNGFPEDIQFSFGEEWNRYGKILKEHEDEFLSYFDIVDTASLKDKRLCDLGCGSGRWSFYLKDMCGELVLVDFSDAIFTARRNMAGADNCLFFMCDITDIPFRNGFSAFLFCLGVLHHMPTPCLDEVRRLKRLAPELLIYLYYSLDNRPAYFRLLLRLATVLRKRLSGVRNPSFRSAYASIATVFIYMPFILAGRLLAPLGLGRYVPLYEAYHDKSLRRIEQDVYDRFFTRIEQRVSRKDILGLNDAFSGVIISDNAPYWHFLCIR